MLADTAIVVVAAGASTRMGFDKAWAVLAGQPLALRVAQLAQEVSPREVVLVVAQHRLTEAGRPDGRMRVVAGGARRRDSVAAGLRATRSAWVAVHDAARALVPPALFLAGVRAAGESGAAIPVVPVKDTIKRVHQGRVQATLPRAELVAVQTPQVFRRDILEAALALSDDDVTDEAALVERLGVPIATFPGDERNFKITTPFDLEMARWLLRQPGL